MKRPWIYVIVFLAVAITSHLVGLDILWVAIALVFLFLALVLQGYQIGWTGFGERDQTGDKNQKTLWDWMVLLIIPAALGFGVLWFNVQQQNTDRELAATKAQIDALEAYLDRMGDILMEMSLDALMERI